MLTLSPRICNLLETWIENHPSDFAVPGTQGALHAFIRQILRQSHTLYYGSDFLPFLDTLADRHDQDEAWAVRAETSIMESDESDTNLDGNEDVVHEEPQSAISATPSLPVSDKAESSTSSSRPVARERKSSIPLSAKSFLSGTLPGTVRSGGFSVSSPSRDANSRLLKMSNLLLHCDSEEVAKEITRQELDLYMKIEPRDWLRHTLVSKKKDQSNDRIARFNAAYNDLHDW